MYPVLSKLVRSVVVTLAIGGALACSTSSAAEPSDTTTTPSTSDPLAAYYITPALCTDGSGPDCTRLRLGDSHLSTSAPGIGKLYSCVGANPSAPGSVRSRITWIDDANSSWNLLRKPFLPARTGTVTPGTITVTELSGTRSILASNLPVDAKIGNWPMTGYAVLSAIDGNPGNPAARSVSFTLPMAPTVATSPGCVSLGAIGVTLNGVVLYNAADARGNDAAAHEIVDVYGGHPAMTDYHYHFVPERLDQARMADGHSGIIGYIRDGYPLYGYKGVGGVEITNADLDICHGHSHGTLGYHYHATIEYPYTIGCYRGTPR
jgi:hypothetical protein